MIKKILAIILCLLLLTSCSPKTNNANENNSKLSIVTTIFPPYDFAKQICGNNANITMLLPPGSEAHNFEPTPKDIIKIQSCDIFIYNGGESDEWVNKILKSFDSSKIAIIKMTDSVTLFEEQQVGTDEEETEEKTHEHLHKHTHNHTHEHNEEWDEHVWTSPANAIQICNDICDTVCKIDSKNKTIYKSNTKQYTEKLKQLDNKFKDAVANAKTKTLIFADRFPARYFTEQYGLNYYAAFPGCADQTEPSSKALAYIMDKITTENIKYVFYIEFSNQKIANVVCEETGAKKLLFNSCHNVTAKQFKNGITYIDLMQNNLNNITEAIN